MTPDPEFLHQLAIARDAINAALNRAAGLEVLEGNRERLAAAPETPGGWRAVIGPIDLREEAAGVIEELLAGYTSGQARDHALDLVQRLHAAAPSIPDGGLRLTDETLKAVAHVIACPRWDSEPLDECPYRDVHRKDVEKRGTALRNVLDPVLEVEL